MNVKYGGVAALLLALMMAVAPTPVTGQADYELGPDSLPQAGVPKGRLIEASYTSPEGAIYPGTVRDYWVYVPAQYAGSEPAALMVFNDGGGYARADGHSRVPTVFDNLIHKGEMPVTIGVFLNPGRVPAARPHGADRRNRSYEYDTMSDVYATFLLEQFLPMVEATHDVKFSTDPDMRGAAGLSTGGIAAFTLAWERPDSFHKVVTYIGTFVDIRSGDNYAGIVRKTSPIGRPLRVFMQDGNNDLDNNHGNWPFANRAMAAALEYMGYDHKLVMGEGSHSGHHGGSIFPDAMRWIWRDWNDQ